MLRLYATTTSFYIRDLSIHKCWYPQQALQPIPWGYRGKAVRTAGSPHASVQNGSQPEGVNISEESMLDSHQIIQKHSATETESAASVIQL